MESEAEKSGNVIPAFVLKERRLHREMCAEIASVDPEFERMVRDDLRRFNLFRTLGRSANLLEGDD